MMLADVAGRQDASLSGWTASAVTREPGGPAVLDWQAFSSAHFPGRRRHDLEALTAYGEYRRSHVEPSPAAGRRPPENNGAAGVTAVQDWEDEGGTTTT